MKHLLSASIVFVLFLLISNELADDDLNVGEIDEEDIVEFIISCAVISPGLIAVRMQDNSMHPVIKENDLVAAKRDDAFVNGKIYLISTFHKRRCIRKVTKVRGGYKLTPANPEFPTVDVAKKNIRFIARVVQIATRTKKV